MLQKCVYKEFYDKFLQWRLLSQNPLTLKKTKNLVRQFHILIFQYVFVWSGSLFPYFECLVRCTKQMKAMAVPNVTGSVFSKVGSEFRRVHW